MSIGTSCLKCKRWKLWNESPCPDHPDFKTRQEIDDAEKWRRANDNMKVMMYVAGIRTTSAFGRKDLFDNVWRNLNNEPLEIVERVVKEARELGSMTGDEITTSLLMAGQFYERVTPVVEKKEEEG